MKIGERSLSEKLFLAAARISTSPVSPKGQTVSGNEMGVAVRLLALGADGLTLEKRELLHDRLHGARKDEEAHGLFVLATGGIEAARRVSDGSFADVSGTVERRDRQDAPAGLWLRLHEPVKVGSRWTEALLLVNAPPLPEGQYVNLHGRLDARTGWGHDPKLEYVTFSNVSARPS